MERALGDLGLAEDARLAAWVFATASSVAFMFDTKVSARYAATSADLAFRSGDANTAALASATLAQVRSATGQGNEAEAEQALKMAREVKDPLRIYEALLGILGDHSEWVTKSSSTAFPTKPVVVLSNPSQGAHHLGGDS